MSFTPIQPIDNPHEHFASLPTVDMLADLELPVGQFNDSDIAKLGSVLERYVDKEYPHSEHVRLIPSRDWDWTRPFQTVKQRNVVDWYMERNDLSHYRYGEKHDEWVSRRSREGYKHREEAPAKGWFNDIRNNEKIFSDAEGALDLWSRHQNMETHAGRLYDCLYGPVETFYLLQMLAVKARLQRDQRYLSQGESLFGIEHVPTPEVLRTGAYQRAATLMDVKIIEMKEEKLDGHELIDADLYFEARNFINQDEALKIAEAKAAE